MNTTEVMIHDLIELYKQADIFPFPSEDVYELEEAFQEEFNHFAPDEFIKGDLNTYWMFIAGLASGGIRTRLSDNQERIRIKELLNGSFYDWYPKYRFIECYDLSRFENLDANIKIYNMLRNKLYEIIEIYEAMV